MELLRTPEAVRDREDIYDYIEKDNFLLPWHLMT